MDGRRTLRSGKEFSQFDLACARAIPAPVFFDVGASIKLRLEHVADDDEDDERAEDEAEVPPFWRAPSPPAPPPPPPVAPPSPALPLSAEARNKLKSRARRDKKREEARAASSTPLLNLWTFLLSRRKVGISLTAKKPGTGAWTAVEVVPGWGEPQWTKGTLDLKRVWGVQLDVSRWTGWTESTVYTSVDSVDWVRGCDRTCLSGQGGRVNRASHGGQCGRVKGCDWVFLSGHGGQIS
ncbi:hypothetical protein B0H11DRAFT_2182876 [Mycena galericulata]|nr:hypothetical protein B0H11DRAFT_2182876 [Mycena galericulata]